MESFLYRILPSSGVPIYRQIMEQTERLVVTGKLHVGDMLPSVRQLAQELEVNPMTISKAYMLLERQGVLERLRGQGMRVTDRKTVSLSLREKLAQLEPAMDQVLAIAHQLGLSVTHVARYFIDYVEDPNHER